ncbi:hypothetical protein B566_EDAN016853 [Ephemera danica]|nr:hypothetical protein B566_EDAN016853 [Ephemera danica]
MLASVEQGRFLRNPCNKIRLISFLAEALQTAGHVVKHAENDADLLIVQTAIDMSPCGEHITVVGNDTDLLVLFIHHVKSVNNIHVLHPSGNKKCEEVYNIRCVQDYFKDAKNTILFAHAVSGCDTTSAIFGKGKITSLNLLMSDEDLRATVQVFYQQQSSYDVILSAGLKFLFKLYGSKDDVNDLNLLRFYMYHRKSAVQPAHRMFSLARLPPTDDSAAQHIYRTYYQVQTWLGQSLSPLDWGWKIVNGKMIPVSGLLPSAPANLIKLISCHCKKGCTKNCSCQRAAFKCSPMCGYCKEVNCKNSEQTNDDTEGYGVLQEDF